MSFGQKIYYNLLYLLIKLLVKTKLVMSESIKNIYNNIKPCYIIYMLPKYSKIDLLTLRKQCYYVGLPDPLKPIVINNKKIPAYIFINETHNFFYNTKQQLHQNSIKIFTTYLSIFSYQSNIKILPVIVLYGRSPEKNITNFNFYTQISQLIKKIFKIIWFRKDSFIYISKSITFNKISILCNNNNYSIINKLARVARIYFFRQKIAITGPNLLNRSQLFNKLLTSQLIQKSINDESKIKNISLDKAKKHALKIINEIAAKFSYEAIRISDHILKWTWHKLYQGINVNYTERVNQLIYAGHNIIYIPSHRSHMDYLLLSYVLYNHGLVPPHIVAGINLNFWPTGIIFRHLGAFFIRRSFKSNKIYSSIFREYFNELITNRYSVEYFIEGGRSRTGRLLEPKTGILSLTIQTLLQNYSKPISIVPIYIGYDHVLEVNSYYNELQGIAKKKEGFFRLIKGLCNLRKLGQSYVNFGQPIRLIKYLNTHIPEWNKQNNLSKKIQKPIWLNNIVDKLANNIMININNTATINTINLCLLILLSSNKFSLTKDQLIKQLNFYIQLLKCISDITDISIPDKTANEIFSEIINTDHAITKIEYYNNNIFLTHKNAIFMSYYKNNIIHLFILPALIAKIILCFTIIKIEQLYYQVLLIYPFLKAELFMSYNITELPNIINLILSELKYQKLIFFIKKNKLLINKKYIFYLQLLANNITDILQRYIITISLIISSPTKMDRKTLEKESIILINKIKTIYSHNSLDCFDKTIFSKLINTLKEEGYIDNNYNINFFKDIKLLYSTIYKLISTTKIL